MREKDRQNNPSPSQRVTHTTGMTHLKAYIAFSFIRFFHIVLIPIFITVFIHIYVCMLLFNFLNYVFLLLSLCIFIVMYVLCILFHCVVLCIVCV